MVAPRFSAAGASAPVDLVLSHHAKGLIDLSRSFPLNGADICRYVGKRQNRFWIDFAIERVIAILMYEANFRYLGATSFGTYHLEASIFKVVMLGVSLDAG